MWDILVYMGLGLVIVVNEIQLRRSKRKVERLEHLWFQVYDAGEDRVVVDHSLKMLEELSSFKGVEWLYKGMVIKTYRKGKGG
ncbi:hypothetical protein ES703_12503 [subsurface metagenome]